MAKHTMIRRARHSVVVLAMLVGLVPLAVITALTGVTTAPAVAAGPGSITLHVQAARSVGAAAGLVHKADQVTSYKWIINQDETGNPGTAADPGTQKCLPASAGPGSSSDPNFADTCPWPSIRKTSGFAPIVAQGDQTDLNDTKALDNLPAGKYLISVTADGFKIDGKHFTVDGGTQTVTVEMNPTPLPLTTLRIQVFNDNTPVDSTYEVGAENPLSGFTAHLTDVFGNVSVDYYGNALCTHYMRRLSGQNGGLSHDESTGLPVAFDAGKPVVDPTKAPGCTSGANGQIMIPNMGPDRYGATVAPPAAQAADWAQTTTLEGGRDWDIWAQEGGTGYDNEVTKGAELVPMVDFGFVHTRAITPPRRGPLPTGEVKGTVIAGLPYIGGTPNGAVDGVQFPLTKNGGPISRPWVALSSLSGGDAAIYVGRGNADGTFDVKNVPDGSYQLSLWDDDLDYILYSFNVEVSGGGVTDVKNQALTGWFTHIHGHVFIDSNGNGRRDPGENSVPQFPLTVRERDNSTMDQAVNATKTDANGAYDIRETYPLGKFLVLEAFNTRYRTTGITYKGENENSWTTKLGSLVDLNFLPIIGLGGEVDWGVKPFDAGTNGGIAGTVSYDTTRNELDPAAAVSEAYQPGIPNVDVHLYASLPCPVTDPVAVKNQCRQGKEIVPLQVSDPADPAKLIDNPAANRGELKKGPELADKYTSEQWSPPRGCTAYDWTGAVLADQRALPEFGGTADRTCVESPMMGIAMGPSDNTPGNAGTTVNGNYAFSTTNLNQYPSTDSRSGGLDQYAPLPSGQTQDLRPGDYIVAVDIPKDPVDGKPMYKTTSEKDVNIFDGNGFLPQDNMGSITPAIQNNPPAGAAPTPTPPAQPPSQQPGIISPCAGSLHKVDVTNQAFLDGGGSPFQGQDRPWCDAKIVTVRSGQTTSPNFNLFTDVPIPTHFWGLTLNDLGLTYDKRSVNYGEAQGIPFVPVGLYDYAGRLQDTVHTDFNGLYEALEPSTDTYNCPVPAGPCPNMYRFVGNDPGQPGHLNSDYNPRFRTIAASFQGWPGLFTVTDEAPTQVANVITTPDTTQANPAQCDLGPDVPQLYAVDRPFVRLAPGDDRKVTLKGRYFGATPGTINFGSTSLPASAITSWTDESISLTVPDSTSLLGPQAISVKRPASTGGQASVNGLTLQVLRAQAAQAARGTRSDDPLIAEVGPGKTYATVQDGLNAATPTRAHPYWLVVVYPNAQDAANPRGEYTENVIHYRNVRLQGVGPGGFDSHKNFVPGSIIDGLGFNPDNAQGAAWLTLLGTLRYSGAPQVPDGAVVTVLHQPGDPGRYSPAIDGFTLTGGVQQNTPTNVNVITGGVKTSYGATGALITQGGGVFVHDSVADMHITDNVITGNGGSYGGGIRIGTPYVDSGNTRPVISRNQVRDNGGTNLAGGIGIFAGSNGYTVSENAICGNHSAEYGGGMTAFGYQGNSTAAPNSISHNRVWFNGSYDEGGGIMVAGELPADPTKLSPGSGPVSIDHNTISTNIANDDGGGIRLLQTSGTHVAKGSGNAAATRAARGTVTVTDNNVVDNISAHEGGGIALDDSAFVDVTGNTVAKNLTTATAVTSDGQRAPAGLSTASNSGPLMDHLRTVFGNPPSNPVPTFSKPTLLANIFWDNRAGSYLNGVVDGLGVLPNGTDSGTHPWDMGMTDTPAGLLAPVNSVLQTSQGTAPSATNTSNDPLFTKEYSVSVDILASRTYPAFREAAILANILPPTQMGDYHLSGTGSSARGQGAASTASSLGTVAFTVSTPIDDLDGDGRPTGTRWDAGSDQMRP